MRPTTLLLLCLMFVGLTGCAGYRLGPAGGQVAGARSVEVQPFKNQTLEPRLSEFSTLALRKRLQQDGTFRLETREPGDIIVTGTLIQFDRSHLSLQPDDVVSVLDYRLAMTAQVVARERSTGRILLDRPVTGQTSLRVGSDLTSAERQAVPLLAEDLARKITDLLADGSW